MFRGFGQYTAEDIQAAPGGDVWAGSIYNPVAINQPSSMPKSGLLPVLDSLVKGVAGVATSWFQYDVAKAQAKAGIPVYRAGLAPAYQRPITLPAGLTTGNLLLIAGAGVGIVLLMKRRGGTSKRRRR